MNESVRRAISSIHRELKCSICHSLINEAQSLPCLHIFCKQCVDGLIQYNILQCPLCNTSFIRRAVYPAANLDRLVRTFREMYEDLYTDLDLPLLSQSNDLAGSTYTSPKEAGRPPLPVPAHEPSDERMEDTHPEDTSPSPSSARRDERMEGIRREDSIPRSPSNSASRSSGPSTPTRECFSTAISSFISPAGSTPPATVTPPARTSTPRRRQPDAIELWSPERAEPDDGRRCHVCYERDSRPVLTCGRCGVVVHPSCYGEQDTERSWQCASCQAGLSTTPACCICPNTVDRAMRPTDDGRWIHVSCALWAPQPTFSETEFGNGGTVRHVDRIPAQSLRLRCVLCRRVGFCLQCEYGRCATPFHVPCAARSSVRLELREMNGLIYFHQLCSRHAHLGDKVETDNTGSSSQRSSRRRPPSTSPARTPKRSAVMPSSSRHSGTFVVLYTSLHDDEFDLLQSLSIAEASRMRLETMMTDDVTHLVVRTGADRVASARTIKYMYAVAKGVWCCSFQWIRDWIRWSTPPAEYQYEVAGDHVALGAPRRSRVSRQQGHRPLFHKWVFIITGPLGPHLGIEVDLAEVIHAAGGTVVKAIPGDRNPQRTVLIQESDGTSDRGARDRCESLGIPVRNMQWVLDLISRQEAPEFDA
ncbi:RING-type E3 ubiquitin transferase BRCA1 [Plasmodiophora brassicae]|nr:hypothetical protein PBRA_004667 [Plasmodiophora brassicae]